MNICFSVECTFFLNGRVNKPNVRKWSDENHHFLREDSHKQGPKKLNVWAKIIKNGIDPPVTAQLKKNVTVIEIRCWMNTITPVHYTVNVRNWLSNSFSVL